MALDDDERAVYELNAKLSLDLLAFFKFFVLMTGFGFVMFLLSRYFRFGILLMYTCIFGVGPLAVGFYVSRMMNAYSKRLPAIRDEFDKMRGSGTVGVQPADVIKLLTANKAVCSEYDREKRKLYGVQKINGVNILLIAGFNEKDGFESFRVRGWRIVKYGIIFTD